MAEFPTFSDLFAIARDEALTNNPRLTLTTAERDGTDLKALLSSAAAVGDECVGQLARTEAKAFLDSSEGKDLDHYVFDKYGIVRKSAAPALGTAVFTTTAPAPLTFSIPVGTVLSTPDNRQFVTLVTVTYPSGSVGPANISVRSTLSGLSQQAAIGTITSIVSQLVGSPGDLVVTNTLATTGASDDETDESLRNRARQFFPNARRGTVDAIQNGALAVPGVNTATAFEVLDAFGRPVKDVQLVIADQFTDALVNFGSTPTYEAQSAVITAAVEAGLADVRAAGVHVGIMVARVVLQSVTLALTFQVGVDYDTVALNARAVVVAAINALSPGVTLTRASLVTQLRSVIGLVITGNEIYAPSGDVVPLPLEVIRTSLALTVPVGLQPVGALQNSLNPD